MKLLAENPAIPLFAVDIYNKFPGLKNSRFWKEEHDSKLLQAILKYARFMKYASHVTFAVVNYEHWLDSLLLLQAWLWKMACYCRGQWSWVPTCHQERVTVTTISHNADKIVFKAIGKWAFLQFLNHSILMLSIRLETQMRIIIVNLYRWWRWYESWNIYTQIIVYTKLL